MVEITRRRLLEIAAGPIVPFAQQTSRAAPDINPRSTWAIDRPARGPLEGEVVRFLLVHHTASGNGHTADEVPDLLRGIYDFHTGPERAWNDIAYNFLIDAGGGIWEGRSGSLAGPVAGDANGGNQGFSQLVSLIGDFDSAQPSPASLDSLVDLLAWLADRYQVATEPGSQVTFSSRGSNLWPSGAQVTTPTITGHRTMSQTSCPGSNLNSYVTGDLMADVSGARLGAAAGEASSSTTTTSTTMTTLDEQVPPTSSTTTTTIPPTPPPTRSPLLLVATVVAGLATLLAAWRARRMGDR
ncbi:MAG: N-acetylmuramoyl-L-alanine amidase [Acidimicrobiia bacterium]